MIIEGKTISQLKKIANSIEDSEIPSFCASLKSDGRKGAVLLAESLERKIVKIQALSEKLNFMKRYELAAEDKGFKHIAGLDEAGRGPLVGPVVAAAVVLDMRHDWTGIDDSKKLSESKRLYFYDKIIHNSLAYGIGIATHTEIDEINILNATKLAMKRALKSVEADYLLIDAVRLADIPIEQESIVKGDANSISIAAASILAKVSRDAMMTELHKLYPQYGFDENKGYGTPKHYAAINEYGVIDAHRRSFLKGFF
ncbi:ribonuclease HII [Fusibacter tunisiensis]|uniref:Ribonuclease HII n=1 Tax=Fusibacter tunisiensis TaxID=1008308 RepID=A0ABS2MMG2_9FIRM|nr:ribonuclease HII [Fusibacter tunisiensis]MBM7560569.1 ribonuclease HII [Fusibacter tunisiensis]